MSTPKNITLNFFGETVSLSSPQSLESLRNSISSLFYFSPEDAKEILLTYNENGDRLVIENDEDLKAFLNSAITTIDLDISQKSQIYQKNLENIKQEKEKDKMNLEKLLKKKEELEKKKETQFSKEKEEIKKLKEKIMKLNKQKNQLRKKIVQGIRKINLERIDTNKKIIHLQKKLGLPVTIPVKKNPNKNANKKPNKPVHHKVNIKKENKKPLEVKFGDIEFINFPKKEDIKSRTIEEWGKCLFNKTQEFTNKLTEKLKDFPILTLPFNNTVEEKKEKKEKKEIHCCVRCDGCGMFPLVGKRFKCKECPNFDFCEKCLEKNKETHKHEFDLIAAKKRHFHPNNKIINRINRINQAKKLQKKLEKSKTMGNIFEKKEENIKTENNNLAEKLIHFGIICDGCGTFPLVGCRYKCAICKDFDFCEECEKKFGEKHNHPFLKIYEPKMTPISFKCSEKK